MTQFVFTYHDGAGMPETEEAVAAEMAAWEAWFGTLGDAVVDGGNPFGGTTGVASDGSVSEGGSSGLGGYSIVDAAVADAAVAMAKGCPILSDSGTVELAERGATKLTSPGRGARTISTPEAAVEGLKAKREAKAEKAEEATKKPLERKNKAEAARDEAYAEYNRVLEEAKA